MYRKKEIFIGIIVVILIVSLNAFFYLKDNHASSNDHPIEVLEPIIIKIDGEVVRETEIIYTKPISYGVLFLRIQNLLNEYSDLSTFSLDEMIRSSTSITIPTMDVHNGYTPTDTRINIHTASLEELMKLPQIGEKRGQKIIDYIKENGRIDSWETFFKIASIPENAKEQIKQQAFL